MKTVDTVINGQSYKLVRMAPLDAGQLAVCALQILAPIGTEVELTQTFVTAIKDNLGKLTDAADRLTVGIELLEKAPGLVSALAGGVSKIDSKALYALGLQCIQGRLFAREKLGSEESMNAHFSERPQDLLPVMAWALKENCAGFFGLRVKA